MSLVPYTIAGKDFVGRAVDSKHSWQRRVYHDASAGTSCTVFTKDKVVINRSMVPESIIKHLKG